MVATETPDADRSTEPRRASAAPRPTGRPNPHAGLRLEPLVEEHSAAVYRLAVALVRDRHLAQDVTQETFIKVWKHLDDFRGESSMRQWILRIAHNTAVSTLRRERSEPMAPGDVFERADAISTAQIVEGREALGQLSAALDELDDLSRAIILLRESEDMPYADIAETLGVNVPTVKTRLLRARRHLARTIGKEDR